MELSSSKELKVREMIGNFIEENPEMKRKDIVQHFHSKGVAITTIYRNFNRFKNGGTVQRKDKGKRYNEIDIKIKDKVIETMVNEVGISLRTVARKNGISHTSVRKILADYGLKRVKRKACPKSDEKQMQKQKTRLNKLRKTYLKPTNGYEVIMDDESYFTTDGSNDSQNDYYYSHESLPPQDSVKFRPRSKFPKKVMVWIAMSSKGFSQSFIIKSGNNVKSQHYIKFCLPRVKKFIDKYHPNDKCIFWPDLARAHYSFATQTELRRLGIEFVPEDQNPPNVPQLRPIERFWGYLKRTVYSEGWTAEDIPQLIKRIKLCIRKVPEKLAHNLMRRVKTKARIAADRGVLSVIN